MTTEQKDLEVSQLENVAVDEKNVGIDLKTGHLPGKNAEEAARILEAAGGGVEYTLADNKRILRKIDLFVCVPMCLTYLLQQLDKSSLSYAAVFDLQTDTHLVGTQYAWLTSVVYCAQLVCQPLSSYALIAFPVKYWVAFNMAGWAIVTACTGEWHWRDWWHLLTVTKPPRRTSLALSSAVCSWACLRLPSCRPSSSSVSGTKPSSVARC